MQDDSGEAASGTWRKGEFVLWPDLLVPVQATLTWLGLFLLVLTTVYAAQGASKPGVIQQYMALRSLGPMQLILTASFDIVMVFYTWRVARRVAKESMVARFGPVAWGVFLTALLGGASLALLSIFVNAELVSHSLVQFHASKAERELIPQSPSALPLGLLCGALIAPFAEEFYFRGVLLSWLRRKMAAPLAILLSASVFALLHMKLIGHPGLEGWVITGTIAAVGVVTATLATVTRSLWGPFAVHAGYNATLFGIAALHPVLFG